MTKWMVLAGLLLIWFGGMLATEGQEAVTAAVAIPGILLVVAGAAVHDRILAKNGLLYDATILDGDEDDDIEEGSGEDGRRRTEESA